MTGTWITAEQATSPDYWVDHLRSTVQFSDGLAALFAEGERALVEIGPGQTLSTFALQHVARPATLIAVPSLRHPQEATPDGAFLARSLARLWLGGVDVDWNGYFAGQGRRRVSLPTYPFERKRFWIEPAVPGGASNSETAAAAAPTPSPEPVSTPIDHAPQPQEESTVSPAAPRKERIVAELKRIIHELSGVLPADIDAHATFLELGFDSLFLAQVTSAIRKLLGIKVAVRQLIEKIPTVDAVGAFLDQALPADAFPAAAAPAPAPTRSVTSPPASGPAPAPLATGSSVYQVPAIPGRG